MSAATRRERRPALELGVAPVALVGEQVIVEPERVPAGALDREAGVAQVAGQSVRWIQNAAPNRTPAIIAVGASRSVGDRNRNTGIAAA